MFGFRKKKTEDTPPEGPAEKPPAPAPEQTPVPEVVQTPSPAPQAEKPDDPVPANAEGATDAVPAPVSGSELEIVVPPRHAPDTILAEFDQEIDRQEDRLYGVALFFECVSLLHAGQAGVLDTNRKQFRNIIVAGHASIGQARVLAEKAKRDPSGIEAVRAFRFTFCEGHPNPIGLAARADALLKAYRRLYPDRPPDKPFTEEETYRLLEAASGTISPVMDGP